MCATVKYYLLPPPLSLEVAEPDFWRIAAKLARLVTLLLSAFRSTPPGRMDASEWDRS